MAQTKRSTTDVEMQRDWLLHSNDGTWTTEQVQAFLLGGVQAELRKVNQNLEMLLSIFRCANFQRMPHELRDIAQEARAAARRRRQRAKKTKTAGRS